MATVAQRAPRRTTSLGLPRHHYKNPPVVEALVDIQVEHSPDFNVYDLRRVRDNEAEKYPEEQRFMAHSLTVDVATGTPAQRESTLRGFRFIGSAGQQIVLVRQDGFAFSKLRPYTSWESWRTEARRLWAKYVEVVRPQAVTRVAVRYVNHIHLKLPVRAFSDYLRTYPEIGPELSQEVAGFVMRLEMPQPDMRDVTLVLSEGRLHDTSDDTASLVLDLDLFRVGRFEPDSEDVWEVLQELHDRENELFEGCITARAREIFDQ